MERRRRRGGGGRGGWQVVAERWLCFGGFVLIGGRGEWPVGLRSNSAKI